MGVSRSIPIDSNRSYTQAAGVEDSSHVLARKFMMGRMMSKKGAKIGDSWGRAKVQNLMLINDQQAVCPNSNARHGKRTVDFFSKEAESRDHPASSGGTVLM